ncbi:MAG: class I SAM-dependent methyltransferase [Candidatus Sungiibacteriota bacterium]
MIHSAYSGEMTQGVNGYLDNELRPKPQRPGEFEFFIDEAKKSGGPVLELASGAARMLMVLAGAGFEVFGVEASWPMIELARKAVAQCPGGVQKRIHIIQGDIRSFAFARHFPLVIIPFNSFWYNFSRNEPPYFWKLKLHKRIPPFLKQGEACVRAIARTLGPGGRFIIDTPRCGVFWERQESDRWWSWLGKEYGFSYEIIKPFKPLEYYDMRWETDVLIGKKL